MDFEFFIEHFPRLLDGVWITLQLITLSTVIGSALALPIALAKHAGGWASRGAAWSYSVYFRGTPLLVQTYLLYYGAGQFRDTLEAWGLWTILSSAYWCAIIAFSLNMAAYVSELLRGAMANVPSGEIEAARALGMSRAKLYRRIIIPKAVRMMLPAYSNEVILSLKATSIASIITVYDLMGQARAIFAATFQMEVYLYAALLYLVIVFAITQLLRLIEWRLTPHLRPQRG